MKTNLLIDNIRASVFIPFLPYDWNIIHRLQEIIRDGVPTVSTNSPLIIGEAVFHPGSWTVASALTNTRIIVQQQKIDFIQGNIHPQESLDTIWKKFCEDTKKIIDIFMSLLSSHASRLAIAPSYIYNDGRDNWKDFIRKSFTKNSFRESELVEGDFSQLFRVKESFNNKYYRINYLSKFYTSNQLVEKTEGVQIIERLNIDFDINTAPDQGYVFNIESMKSFFDNARNFSELFLGYYFD